MTATAFIERQDRALMIAIAQILAAVVTTRRPSFLKLEKALRGAQAARGGAA